MKRLLAIALAFLAVHAVAAPTIGGVSPSVADAASMTRWTITGSDLAGIEGVALRRPGAPDTPLQIVSQSAAQIEAAANTAALSAALHHIVYTYSGGQPGAKANAVEIRRGSAVEVGGLSTATTEYPLHRGALLVNTEIILYPEELGRAGSLEGLAIHPTVGAGAASGTITARLKEASGSTFASNNLDAAGWTTLHTGGLAPVVGGSPLVVSADTPFVYSGTLPLRISFLFEADSTGSSLLLEGFASGVDRTRAGRALSSGTPVGDWSGSTPALRTLSQVVPRITVIFSDLPVTAAFSVSHSTASVGEAVTFANSSTAAASAWRWDFDRDGVVDSTDRNPIYIYTSPGVFDVELVAVNGSNEDSETKLGLITVVPASANVEEWPTLGALE